MFANHLANASIFFLSFFRIEQVIKRFRLRRPVNTPTARVVGFGQNQRAARRALRQLVGLQRKSAGRDEHDRRGHIVQCRRNLADYFAHILPAQRLNRRILQKLARRRNADHLQATD